MFICRRFLRYLTNTWKMILTMNKNVNHGNSGKRETLVWTPRMDVAFIQAMLKEQDKGNMIDGTFTSQAYMSMVEELIQNMNQEFNKNHLKNRLKTIKKHFFYCYDVFSGGSLSGFTWNPKSKLFEAEEEVWEELLAIKPDAAKWKTKTVLNYNELHELFARERATGANAETAKERRKRMNNDEEKVEIIDGLDQFLSVNDISLETNNNNGDDINITSTSSYSQKKPKKSKKKKVEEERSEIASKIASSIEYLADCMKECTKAIVGSRPRVHSEEEIFNELELMGVGEHSISKAYIFLVRSPENTRALFGCPRRMRITILKEMMGTLD